MIDSTATFTTATKTRLNWIGLYPQKDGRHLYRKCCQCTRLIKPRGWASHKKACDRKAEALAKSFMGRAVGWIL